MCYLKNMTFKDESVLRNLRVYVYVKVFSTPSNYVITGT
jgi:hypothetical protein